MPTISTQIISFRDYATGNYQLCADPYGIASYVLTPSRIAAGMNCPFNASEDNCAFFFVNVDGIVAVRTQHFGSRFYAGGKIVPAGIGSALETAEAYRHLGVGADSVLFSATNSEYPVYIGSGISDMSLALYRKLHYYILEFPRIMQLRDARCFLESKGIKGIALKWMSKLLNMLLNLFVGYANRRGRKLQQCYQVEKVTKVPVWVDEIVLNDGHKYMEVHDHLWLQWNLDYNFRGLSQDIQSFYVVKERGNPVGFFMTKERFREKAGGVLKNILIGSIVEWGIAADCALSEMDLYAMALLTFSKDVDIVETATIDRKVIKQMKRFGFITHGYAHIGMKDKKKQYRDAADINLWRVRYGYADVILT